MQPRGCWLTDEIERSDSSGLRAGVISWWGMGVFKGRTNRGRDLSIAVFFLFFLFME